MAAATLAMKVVGASVTVNHGATANTAVGTTTLTLVFEATASAASVPLAAASDSATASACLPKAMIGTALTLNYDDVTGVITSLT